MMDYAITGATVLDGTGSMAFRADVGIEDGRIVAVGEVDGAARTTIDANGLVVAPGFIDPHTHYDAQLYWDPMASPSAWHGVTTVIAGNCGFTLAPLRAKDADYTRKMMAQVEGMPLQALEDGLPWTWESFGEYLNGLDGRVGVNAGFNVGHCALRRYVLGEDFARPSTPQELRQIAELLRPIARAGGIGLSTTRSNTHIDAEGNPVPSRWASEEEVLTLCEVVSRHDGTSLEFISSGCIGRFEVPEVEFIAEMTRVAGRPLNWNVLAASSGEPDRVEHQLGPSRRARQLGGRVLALTMPIIADNNQSFLTFCGMWLIPGWRDVLSIDVPERIRRLKDPAVRDRLAVSRATSPIGRLADFDRFVIGDVFSGVNEQYRNRRVGEIAAERGEDPFTAIVDIVAADELRTVLWPLPVADTDADWEMRRSLWEHPDVMIGGSDAGAHLDRMLGAAYPTRFLADCLRGRQLVSMEQAVHLMSDVPARVFGLHGRGRVATGYQADLVLFDPTTVGAAPVRTAFDLPGANKRLLADPIGVSRVFVNGVQTLIDGAPTGETPGLVLRGGKDTTGPNLAL